MRYDMSGMHPLVAIAPVVATDDTALVSAIIDRQGFNDLAFVISTGTLADVDATFAVTMHHGEVANLSDAVEVPVKETHGTLALASFTFAEDVKTRKIGYLGIKRYVRLTITPTGNAGNAPISAMAWLGGSHFLPTPNPPS